PARDSEFGQGGPVASPANVAVLQPPRVAGAVGTAQLSPDEADLAGGDALGWGGMQRVGAHAGGSRPDVRSAGPERSRVLGSRRGPGPAARPADVAWWRRARRVQDLRHLLGPELEQRHFRQRQDHG